MLSSHRRHNVRNPFTILFLIVIISLIIILYSFERVGVYATQPTLTATDNTFTDDSNTEPQSQVLVINQVRGSECCDAGSLQHLQFQLATHQRWRVPATFSLRYDVLSDARFMNTLKAARAQSPDLISLGLLLEVTPSLAQAAGVPYQGTEDNWYEAQNVFTIGYSENDRKKLMDVLFAAYHDQLGEYPRVTTAWLMDTPTLNYLHDEYGVAIHQITREQWGVDSYTLVGGPPHYPYPASRKWVFVPDYQQDNPLWIVRQTLTDPLYNYGDTSSSYTSQPNDYARGQRGFGYFEALIEQALFGQVLGQAGFALLGLENSMGDQYQQAFADQLALISRLSNEHKLSYYDIDTNALNENLAPVSIYGGRDLIGGTDHQSWWITTPQYRVRLRANNTQVFIDDLRIFSAELLDPYFTHTAQNKGFWIMPSLLDGSLWYGQNRDRPLLAKLLGPPEVKGFTFVPSLDLNSYPVSLMLPPLASQSKVEISLEGEEGRALLTTESGETQIIRFRPDRIIWEDTQAHDLKCPEPVPAVVPLRCRTTQQELTLEWLNHRQEATYSLTITCQSNESRCEGHFQLDAQKVDDQRVTQYPFFFPEARPREISQDYTLLYAHNRYAIAGRNPVRLVLVAADTQGFPTLPNEGVSVTTEPEISHTSTKQESLNSPLQFIDLIHNQPQKTAIEVTVDDAITKTMTVYFAPNCKQEWLYCLTHPRQAWWYVNTIARDKIRANVFGEAQ